MVNDRPDDQFDLVYAPQKYGALNATAVGRWTALSSADGEPLGIAWTDGADAAGFIQAGPSELSEDVWSDFTVSAGLKIPALSAYQMAKHKRSVVASQEKTGELSEVYRDLSKLLDTASAITAAIQDAALENVPDDAHIFLTVTDEDENEVLELVRSDETGMYIRDSAEWVPFNTDDDNPRVWDRILIDVTVDAAQIFDQAQKDGRVTADLFDGVLAPEEEPTP